MVDMKMVVWRLNGWWRNGCIQRLNDRDGIGGLENEWSLKNMVGQRLNAVENGWIVTEQWAVKWFR